MSPRRNRPKGDGSSGPSGRSAEEDRSDRYGGWQTSEPWQGEEWSVRHVAGASAAGKTYRCPGCDQMIASGVPHLVAWPEHSGVDEQPALAQGLLEREGPPHLAGAAVP